MRFEPIQAHHAALVWSDVQDPAMYERIDEPRPGSVAELEARYAKLAAGSGNRDERWRNWIVFDGDAPIGHLQATLHDDRLADVAWVIFPRYWRRGFGTLAVRWLLRNLDLDNATLARATIDPRNVASLALAAKLGFAEIAARDGDVIVARPVREPDAIVADWDHACRMPAGDSRGHAKCQLVPHLGALAAIDDRGLGLLGDALADRDGWSENDPYSPGGDTVTRLASVELGRLGTRAEPVLAAKLAQLDAFACEHAIRALCCLPALTPATIAEVVRVAGVHPGASFAAAVGDVLAKHHVDCTPLLADPKTRYSAIVGSPNLDATTLIELLGDARSNARGLAINRLLRTSPRPDHAAPALIALLVDRDRDVARHAAEALEYLAPGDPAVTRALLNAIAIPTARSSLLGRPRDQLAELLPEIRDASLAAAIRAKLTSG